MNGLLRNRNSPLSSKYQENNMNSHKFNLLSEFIHKSFDRRKNVKPSLNILYKKMAPRCTNSFTKFNSPALFNLCIKEPQIKIPQVIRLEKFRISQNIYKRNNSSRNSFDQNSLRLSAYPFYKNTYSIKSQRNHSPNEDIKLCENYKENAHFASKLYKKLRRSVLLKNSNLIKIFELPTKTPQILKEKINPGIFSNKTIVQELKNNVTRISSAISLKKPKTARNLRQTISKKNIKFEHISKSTYILENNLNSKSSLLNEQAKHSIKSLKRDKLI